MELKTKNWPYIAIGSGGFFILLLGAWWLYLVINLGHQISVIPSIHHNQMRMINMLKWEGITFFVLLLGFIISLLYVFFQDKKKSHSIQAFLASMTHELKTPLASIKLQSDFIHEIIDENNNDIGQIKKLITRLNEDVQKLENQLDRTLQLARIEKGGHLNLTTINLKSFLHKITKNETLISFDLKVDESIDFLADEFSLNLIFKNLIENTKTHLKSPKIVSIEAKKNNNKVLLSYDDHGEEFDGDIKKLATLFYKHNSPKGTGIGLYLIKKLMRAMKGDFEIQHQRNLIFHFSFLAINQELVS